MIVKLAFAINIIVIFLDMHPEYELYKKADHKGVLKWYILGLRVEDLINPVKWWRFVVGFVRAPFLQPHILEQIVMRRLICPECVERKKCVACGCNTWAKMLILDEECSKGKWGKIDKRAKDWYASVREYQIELGLTIGGEKIK